MLKTLLNLLQLKAWDKTHSSMPEAYKQSLMQKSLNPKGKTKDWNLKLKAKCSNPEAQSPKIKVPSLKPIMILLNAGR